MPPPPAPVDTLARVVRRGRFNGGTVLVIAGAAAIVSMVSGDYLLAVIALAAAAAGAAERHGASLLRGRDPRGLSWLVGSQFYLAFVVLAYCLWRLVAPEQSIAQLLTAGLRRVPGIELELARSGVTRRELLAILRKVYFLTYMLLAVLTTLYQGGLALYYHRRRPILAAALAAQPAR